MARLTKKQRQQNELFIEEEVKHSKSVAEVNRRINELTKKYHQDLSNLMDERTKIEDEARKELASKFSNFNVYGRYGFLKNDTGKESDNG